MFLSYNTGNEYNYAINSIKIRMQRTTSSFDIALKAQNAMSGEPLQVILMILMILGIQHWEVLWLVTFPLQKQNNKQSVINK